LRRGWSNRRWPGKAPASPAGSQPLQNTQSAGYTFLPGGRIGRLSGESRLKAVYMTDQIAGWVDSVADGLVQGWIANIDNPAKLERVICRGADGSTLMFQPFVPRQDVCDALSLNGRFGFAIPISALRSLGPVVSFAKENGSNLRNGEALMLPTLLDVPEPDAFTWVVLHIQKTAGTSLRSALAASVRPNEAVFVYPDGFVGLSPLELSELPLIQRSALRLVMGHAYFGIAEYLPQQADYITVLRDPEARLRSHYYHHVSTGTIFRIDGAIAETPFVVQQGLTDEFDNLMTRMLAGADTDTVPIGAIGEEHVETALRHIRTSFRFVGLTEHLDDHYPVLCRIMGISAGTLAVENTRSIDNPASLDDKVDWREVMHRNRFDTMLYRRVQEEGLCGRDLRNLPKGPRRTVSPRWLRWLLK
jgi:hypothetical protein